MKDEVRTQPDRRAMIESHRLLRPGRHEHRERIRNRTGQIVGPSQYSSNGRNAYFLVKRWTARPRMGPPVSDRGFTFLTRLSECPSGSGSPTLSSRTTELHVVDQRWWSPILRGGVVRAQRALGRARLSQPPLITFLFLGFRANQVFPSISRFIVISNKIQRGSASCQRSARRTEDLMVAWQPVIKPRHPSG